MVTSLDAKRIVSLYFLLAVSAFANTYVFGGGFPVSISAIFFYVVELCHKSSNRVLNEFTMVLLFVQRHRSSASGPVLSDSWLTKNATSASSLISILEIGLKPISGVLLSKPVSFGILEKQLHRQISPRTIRSGT